jgi:hypothetical protein
LFSETVARCIKVGTVRVSLIERKKDRGERDRGERDRGERDGLFVYLLFYVSLKNEMTKITNRNQSHKSCRKYKSENGRTFHLYGDVTITGEELQTMGLCSSLKAFVQGGIFIVHTFCDARSQIFRSHSKDCPTQLPLTTLKVMWRTYSNLDPHD